MERRVGSGPAGHRHCGTVFRSFEAAGRDGDSVEDSEPGPEGVSAVRAGIGRHGGTRGGSGGTDLMQRLGQDRRRVGHWQGGAARNGSK